MQGFSSSKGKGITFDVARAICENSAYLSEIDGLIGDGDHGANMKKGFGSFMERAADEDMDFSGSLMKLGRTLLDDIGGSMGPLYGTFFIKMARVCRGVELIDAGVIKDMLIAAWEGVCELGGAKAGDKTMIDCLEPAAQAFASAFDAGSSLSACLDAMSAAAEKGRDATKDMIAKLGRSSRLKERSAGVLDAGAASCCIILQAMAKAICENIVS